MISPRKPSLEQSIMHDERGTLTPTSHKSCESVYSVPSSRNSANIVYRCKLGTRTAGGINCFRQPSVIPAATEVRQRVLSARRLRIKTYQNQLTDAQNKIAELSAELRILRTVHKRQDNALAKYESNNAELPQLLHSHAEELRMWQTKYRNVHSAHKALENKLKQKENLLLILSDQNKYYSQLNKEKGLEDRQRLADKLAEMESRVQAKDNELKNMNRKMQIEMKNHKQQLSNEQKKTKDALLRLEKLRLEISGYRKLEELDLIEKLASIDSKKPSKTTIAGQKQSKVLKALKTTSDSDNISLHSSSSMISPKIKYHKDDETKSIVEKSISNNGMRSVSKTNNSTSNLDMNSTRTVRKMPCGAVSKSTTRKDIDIAKKQSALKPPNCGNNKSKTKSVHIELPQSYDNEKSDDTYDYDNDEGIEHDKREITDSTDAENLNEISMAHCVSDGGQSDAVSDANTEDTDYTEPQSILSADSARIKAEIKEIKCRLANDKLEDQHVRENISTIRKQLSDDFKERDVFLDSFCLQATNSALRSDMTTKLRKDLTIDQNALDSTRRHRLLAALETIDD